MDRLKRFTSGKEKRVSTTATVDFEAKLHLAEWMSDRGGTDFLFLNGCSSMEGEQ